MKRNAAGLAPSLCWSRSEQMGFDAEPNDRKAIASWLDLPYPWHIICHMTLPSVVLDTNILVAAARSRRGASFALLQALRNRRYRALVSVPLLLECEAVLNRPEHLAACQRSAAMHAAFLDALCLLIEPVHLHYLWRPQLRDPADEMVLETALNGGADALITLNVGDFTAAAHFRLPVTTPGGFLQQLNEEKI